jgi:hypothetical protein
VVAAPLASGRVVVHSPEEEEVVPDTEEDLASNTDRHPFQVLALVFVPGAEKNPDIPRATEDHPVGQAISPVVVVAALGGSVLVEEVADLLANGAAVAADDFRIVVVAPVADLHNIPQVACCVVEAVALLRNVVVEDIVVAASAPAVAQVQVHPPVSGVYLFYPPVGETS